MIELGSSDAPAVLGVDPFRTSWQLWAEKVGLIERLDQPTEVMKAGTTLQDVVLNMELDEFLIPVLVVRQLRQYHPSRRWQRATPDGVSDLSLYEVKCLVGQPPSAPRVSDVVQCLHQLLVFDADCVRLIYFGGLRRERFIIPRHQRALDRVLREEERFLELVEKEIPPPVSARDSSVLWRAWPLVADRVVQLPPEYVEVDRAMVDAKATADEATERYEAARARIKLAIGDAMRATLPDGTRYSWKPTSNGHRPLRRFASRHEEEA
jgi:hypothetical protein